MNQPLISVIVPVYNTKDYLSRCVESIIEQTYRCLDIILVDDGSTDGTAELCDCLAQRDERIKVFHKNNGGASSARNLGIQMSKGDFLGFVDSDDFLETDMYEKMVNVLGRNGGKIAQIGRDERDEQGNKLSDICVPPNQLEFVDSQSFLRELLLHRGDCSFCTKLVRRELFATQKFPEGVLNEDFYLLIQMLSCTEGIYCLPEYGYHVSYRIGSTTRKADRNTFSRVYADCVRNADMVYEIVQERYPQLGEEAVRFGLFQRLEYLLHIPIDQMKKDNAEYHACVSYLRMHLADIISNHYLTAKNKLYLLLFCTFPATIRKIHRRLRNNRL